MGFNPRRPYIRVGSLVDPRLFCGVPSGLASDKTSLYRDRGGSEIEYDEDAGVSALLFALNDPALLRKVERRTGCAPLRSFSGRVYGLRPSGDRMHWHDDRLLGRKVALTLNLSRRSYRGGELEIRQKNGKKPVFRVKNTRLGAAVLFPVSKRYEHRVLPVSGRAPKIALAGWFTSRPGVFSRSAHTTSIRSRHLSGKHHPSGAPVTSDRVVYRLEKDRVSIFNPHSRRLYGLEGVGAEVWRMLCRRRSFDQILNGLSRRYPQPPGRLRADTARLLLRLRAEKLIVG